MDVVNKISKIHKIVAIGDSITYGMSASSQEMCWASLVTSMLEELIGHPMKLVNKGICANILSVDSPAYSFSEGPSGLERFRKDIIEEKPDLVFIAYGLNDSRGGTSAQTFRKDYQEMLSEIRKEISPIIVVLNLFYMHEITYHMDDVWNHSDYEITEEFNLIIQQLAKKNNLILADVYSAQKGVDWSVCDDHCHPNDLGHRLIANRVFEAIVHNCPI